MGKMGEALVDLEKILRSNKVNAMTLEEANIIMACKAQGIRDLVIGSATSTMVAYLATPKLGRVNRICLTTGVGSCVGLWWFGRSLDSCVDHILSMEGKRIKDELAKIVLMKYRDNPSVMQRVSKHFYSENVYDDSSMDRPKLRWRKRTFYSDPIAYQRMRTHADDPDNEITYKERTTAADKIKMLRNQEYIRTTVDSIVDPFDHVFGLAPPMSENHQPDSSVLHAQSTHSQRRSRRRHRKRHHENVED
ncbi:hypothetical protein LIER_07270 [Lithospermum erythrorhizon]|uniref:Uncharacterized protein n=1 Tax=Lithospermum erythrorhizon TaxID=34254 RepID=A0AAV3P8U1_LITER